VHRGGDRCRYRPRRRRDPRSLSGGRRGRNLRVACKNDAEAATQTVYLSFWLFSPRSDNLLEGGVLLDHSQGAKVDLLAGSDDGAKIWLDGKLVLENRGKNPLQADQYTLTGLSLKKGWNHFLVRVANDRGGWQFQARLACRYPTLAPLLQTDVVRPGPQRERRFRTANKPVDRQAGCRYTRSLHVRGGAPAGDQENPR